MNKNILMLGAAMVGLAAVTPLPAQQQVILPLRFQVNGNTVTGAPYSADAVTETTQTLTDGNRIERSSSIRVYRDSQGRERQEEGSPEKKRIVISDPVAKTSFAFDPQTHTAQQSSAFQMRDVENQFRAKTLQLQDLAAARQAGFGDQIPILAKEQPATEQLSPKTMEGVFAKGTRSTHTIPAGQIGNRLPIQVVDEAWYSPDLQMNIMTRHSDPRTGEVVYQLKGISRAEPDSSLFEVPADYKITDGGRGRTDGGRGRSGGVAP